MSSIDWARRHLAYDAWANEQLLYALKAMDTPPASAVRWLAHIVAAQQVWLSRMKAEDLPVPVWPEWSLAEIEAHLENMRGAWEMYLDGLGEAGVGATFDYANSRGESFTSRIDEAIAHLGYHGAHHRGQIIAELRAKGTAPPETSYIHYVRSAMRHA